MSAKEDIGWLRTIIRPMLISSQCTAPRQPLGPHVVDAEGSLRISSTLSIRGEHGYLPAVIKTKVGRT